MSVQRVSNPMQIDVSPLSRHSYFETGFECLFAFFKTRIKNIAFRIQFLKTVLGIEIEFERFVVHKVDTASHPTKKQILALVQIQWNKVARPLVFIVSCQIWTLAAAYATAQSDRTLRHVKKRNFRNLLSPDHGCNKKRNRKYYQFHRCCKIWFQYHYTEPVNGLAGGYGDDWQSHIVATFS